MVPATAAAGQAHPSTERSAWQHRAMQGMCGLWRRGCASAFRAAARSPAALRRRFSVASVPLGSLVPPRLKDAAPSEQGLPCTIILHGLLGSATNWRSILWREDMLPGRYVCALDLRNHGRSSHAASMTYPEMAADVIRFVDEQLGVREISVIGHSMGGKVAMELALAYPDRVANLVVVDISPVAYSSTLMHTGPLRACTCLRACVRMCACAHARAYSRGCDSGVCVCLYEQQSSTSWLGWMWGR